MNNNIEMTFILKSNEIKEVGFGGAAILNTFSFWLMKNKANKKHLHDGYYWTYNSKRALSEIFYFWTERQVRNQIDKLVKNGYIIIGEYNSAKYDRTSWYALTKKAWDLLKLEDINEYNDETIENTDLTKMSEEKESLRQKCQNHLTKMSDGCDQKVNTIPSINTSINTSINKEKNIKKENEVENTYYDETKKDENVEIFEFWNSKKIIVHRNLTDSMKKRIKSKLKKYTVDEIKEAINVYSVILNDSNCIFSYKWSLEDFLTGEDRMKKFLKGGTHYENYFKPNNTQPKKTYTTNVPNKNNSNNFENVKSEYVPDYKKNFNPIYHDPKSHANFEISDTMKQLTTNSEFASEFENKALGFDEFDEDDDINPFTGQKRNTSGIVCKQTIENTNQNQF